MTVEYPVALEDSAFDLLRVTMPESADPGLCAHLAAATGRVGETGAFWAAVGATAARYRLRVLHTDSIDDAGIAYVTLGYGPPGA